MDDDFILAVDLGLIVFLADADIPAKLFDHIFSLPKKFFYSLLPFNLLFCGDLGNLAFADAVNHFIEVGLLCRFLMALVLHM